MPNNDDVMGAMMFEKAQKEYPYLAGKDISFMYSPQQDDRMLEFWHPDEPGSSESPRPDTLPLGKPGVQVFNPKTSPLDILGDYVSHYGVQADPRLAAMYQQFGQSLDPAMMQRRYAEHQQMFGEKRPYEDWYSSTGLPEYFRGYTFNQWPDAAQMYTPEQLQILNQVRQYLGVK
jgi:hypothetical protein